MRLIIGHNIVFYIMVIMLLYAHNIMVWRCSLVLTFLGCHSLGTLCETWCYPCVTTAADSKSDISVLFRSVDGISLQQLTRELNLELKLKRYLWWGIVKKEDCWRALDYLLHRLVSLCKE